MGLLNKMGGLFGLGGGQGEYYQAAPLQSEAKTKLEDALKMGDNETVQRLVRELSSEKGLSLSQLMDGARSTGDQDAALQNLVSSPIAGSQIATEMVQEDDILGNYFADGGSLDQAIAQEANLANRGFSLQPEDYEAYGQASGNVARSFGKQEQSLAQALAARGLSAGNSGAAQKGFSNMYGNKFEQLGQLQRQIADDRVKTNAQRLAETRNYLSQLGGLGAAAQGQMYNQNQTANQQQSDMYGKDIAAYTAQEQARQASQASKEANRQLGLGDAIASGIYKGIEAAPSIGLSAALGGAKGGGEAGASNTPTADRLQSIFNSTRRSY